MKITKNINGHVLIVEDDEDTAEILKEMLCSQGFTVSVAQCPAIGLSIIQSAESFDAILIDYRMPVMNGIEFLRQAGLKITCPAVMLTGFPSRQVREDAIRAGVTEFALKPMPPKNLAELMNKVIRSHRNIAAT